MTAWTDRVKMVAKKNNISYREAMKVASKGYKKKETGQTKKDKKDESKGMKGQTKGKKSKTKEDFTSEEY